MKKREITAYLFLEGALFACFLLLDILGKESAGVKYASIALCFCFAVLSLLRGGSREIALAMGFSLIADTFLVLLDRYMEGVFFFCFVQGVYLCAIGRRNGRRTLWWLRAALFAVFLLLLWRLRLLLPLNVLVLFYFSNFAVNVLLAFLGDFSRRFRFGLLLFLLCDVCVGLFNIPELIPAGLWRFAGFAIWIFYLPGQTLLTLSGLPKEGTAHEEK